MTQKPKTIISDFLIIGSGLAGLYSAFYASNFGTVSLITKSTLDESNSYWAQGGIAAAIDPDDSPLYHEKDTLEAGRGLCNRKAVEILVSEGKERVLELINLGMKFDTGSEGYDLGMEGGHSRRRVLHAGGTSTGEKMADFLISEVKNNNKINVFEYTHIIKLLSNEGMCYGGIAINYLDKNTYIFNAKSTILSTGGASALYKKSTNPPGAIGEGIALAYNEGAEVMDMEFIQFHPTAFYSESGRSFLISEALRGEGAILLNERDERFLENISQVSELAPRDIVASAIFREIRKSKKQNVFLSVKHLDPDFIKKKFKNIYQYCLSENLDITKDYIPVAPAAHYFIGGIKTGLMGETNIKGLYACGEVACNGVHGANRLASNSLLECLVFSRRAVDNAKQLLDSEIEINLNIVSDIYRYESNKNQEIKYIDLKNKLSEIMNEYVGIVRKEEELKLALEEIDKLQNSIDISNNYYFLQIRNVIKVCMLITRSALFRQETRGAHIREKYPKESSKWRLRSVWNNKSNKPVKLLHEDQL